MTLKLESPDNYVSGLPIHLGIYSYNGVGKTTLAGKTGMRTIHIDCSDAGAISLKGCKTTRVIRVKSTTQYVEAIHAIMKSYVDKIDLLVPDTLTGLQSLAIREVKGRGDMNRRKWGQVSSKMIECIAETAEFPKDVIYLIQEKNKNLPGGEDMDGSIEIMPSLVPSVREFFSSRVDWIGRLYLEGGDRKITFIIDEHLEVKDRAGIFPKVIANPNYPGLRKRIQESMTRR